MTDTSKAKTDLVALTQKVNDLERLYREGKLHLGAYAASIMEDLSRVRRDGNRLVVPETVSPALRALALGSSYLGKTQAEHSGASPSEITDPAAAQRELFMLFHALFVSIAGKKHTKYSSEDAIRADIIRRVKKKPGAFAAGYNHAVDEIGTYYNKYMHQLFREAKRIAGLKLVVGGQTQFLGSQLNGVRQMMLYADTVLIPDPIYPFMEPGVEHVAVQLQMAITLFHLLKLKPLVDAELPYPAVFVFPSFERSLELNDVVTQQGILALTVKLVRDATGAELSSMAEVAEFATKREAEFMTAVTQSRLFIPPGHDPDESIDAYRARDQYLTEITGKRPEKDVEKMRALPPGLLALQGVWERVRPQYHLLENADSLSAQPMVVMPVQWHYLERVSLASSNALERQGVLPKGSFAAYRGLQDSSLAWLGNVPIDALVKLRRDEANRDFRKRMAELTKELELASVSDVERIAREVAHGIASLINTHQKEIRDLEARYASKYTKTLIFSGGGAAILTAASPYLPILGALMSGGSLAVAGSGLAVAYAKDKVDELAEKWKLKRSLIGVLAMAKKFSAK